MTQPLFGREREQGLLAGLVDALPGRGAALVVRGEPGIGKSSLLAFARTYAETRAVRVLTTAGVESEAQYPFAGLHRLLRPLMGSADALPTPLRDALRSVFGLSGAAAPTPYLVALAVLNLLGEAAEPAPLVLIAEDAHWLDRSTGDVLGFVARRLEADPVLLLMAVRDGVPGLLADAGLPELRLAGLADEAARALLAAHAPDLPPAALEQLLAYALGNPLALVELPAGMGDRHLTGTPGGLDLLSARVRLTERLEGAFAARYLSLPDAARTLLLVAAVNDSEHLGEVLAAAAHLGGAGGEALASAVSAGLLALEGSELRFRHPLVRSAVYQMAPAAARNAAHAALAEVAAHPIRQAWHRAAAALRPDERVASELETAAGQARQQGAVSCAVAGLERAAALTPDGLRRRSRLLQAAELAFELGRSDLADRLLRQAEPADLTPTDLDPLDLTLLDRARMTLMREILGAEGTLQGAGRVLELAELADRVGGAGHPELALTLLRVAALRVWSAGYGSSESRVGEHLAAAAERVPVARRHPQRLVILAVAEPVRRGREILGHLAKTAFGPGGDPHTTRLFAQAAFVLGDMERAATLFQETVAGLRAQGRLGLLAPAQALRAWAAVHLGDPYTARSAAEEAGRLARETRQPEWAASAELAEAALAGLRGEHKRAECLAEQAERFALPTGNRGLLAAVQRVRGVVALGGGRPAEAYDHLRRPFDPGDPSDHPVERWWALGYLAEAAVLSGHEAEARAVVAALEPDAAQTPSPGLHLELRYARAVLAPDAEAEAYYEAALAANPVRWPFVRARLNLAYGGWLRRQRRVAESRAPLQAARAAFDALGALPWGERARAELRASGVTSRPRTAGVSDALSPQELQIVQMAAGGLTNREIGQQLYLSPRTVASHLYRAFPKLGVTSRHQLPGTFS